MFAHQVIEDLHMHKRIIEFDHQSIIEKITNSQKFNLGKLTHLQDLFMKFEGKPIIDMLGGVFHLPYSLCWFDYARDLKNTWHSKAAVMFEDLLNGSISATMFLFYNAQRWIPIPFSIIFKSENIEVCGMLETFKGLSDFMDNGAMKDGFDAGMYKICVAMMGVSLLSCKNISAKENYPDKALNKARIKRGKLPLFTHKTLVIKPTTKKQENQQARGLWDNRVHLCRGHFKNYTEANPLFGRITGRYWWQPCVRGQNKKGVVMKDYKIES